MGGDNIGGAVWGGLVFSVKYRSQDAWRLTCPMSHTVPDLIQPT